MDAGQILVWTLRVALAVAFTGMGISHFVPPVRRGMRAMIPPALRRPGFPSPTVLVAVTGVCELAGGIGIVAPWQLIGTEWMRWLVGILLVAFLIAVFPANAYAAAHPEKFGRAAFPFWPRYVAQLALIVLVTLATAPGVG
ncbi:MAG: hypothetical protein ABI632_05055 [Pseudolysinimonas sp.]